MQPDTTDHGHRPGGNGGIGIPPERLPVEGSQSALKGRFPL